MLSRPRIPAARAQQGMVLIVALVVLVVMALSTAAMLYSTGAGTWLVGNLTFRQSAVASGDQGVEKAIAWLKTTSSSSPSTLYTDVAASGYHATTTDMTGSQSPATLWSAIAGGKVSLDADAAGNRVAYAIERLCSSTGEAATGTCAADPSTAECGQSHNVNSNTPGCTSQVYYRITVRTEGPRNTVSYTQAMVAL
jgi:Tfp pilus assembly protein PilX